MGDGVGTELSRALLALRDAMRQVDVAARTGLSQARLSRIEQGKSLPTEDEVRELARLYSADEDQVDELVKLAHDLRAGIRDSRLVVQRGNTLALQQRWNRIEGQATTVRSYHPVVVLGVLQTPAYAAVASRHPVDSAVVASRVRRHERLLAEPGRRHLLIQTEGALRQTVGSAAVMTEQLDAILAAAEAPNVELGVIPTNRPLDLLVGSGFHVYDDTAAVVGLEVAAATLTEASDVAHFRGLWDRLWEAAVTGADAVGLIQRVAGHLRG
ncbi:MAG: helix-turn-helix domain-containing protein [Pseudonocardiaceae bacterium]|nr:helix-turn-helix domain-containing protein [Pseudonocardiaceae bacterium]